MNTQTTGNYPDVSRPDAETTELYTQSYDSSDATAGTGADQLTDKAGQVADQAKAVVGDTAGKVRDQALSQIDAQKGRATDALSNISQAVRKTGDHLREQDQASIAQYADAAAEQLDRFSTYLNNRDIGQMSTELQHFARRQPAIFLGGALVAGLIAARFLKSSSQQAQNYGGQMSSDYTGRGSYSSYGAYGGYGGYNDQGYQGQSSYAGSQGYDAGSNYGEDYSSPASVRTNVTGYGSGANPANPANRDRRAASTPAVPPAATETMAIIAGPQTAPQTALLMAPPVDQAAMGAQEPTQIWRRVDARHQD